MKQGQPPPPPQQQPFAALPRTSSCKSSKKIIPANNNNNITYPRSYSSASRDYSPDDKSLVPKNGSNNLNRTKTRIGVSSLLRSLISIISFPAVVLPTCRWLNIPSQFSFTPSLGRKVTGTLFGHRRGHVSFAVQDDPKSDPVLLIELAISTSSLVKEMSSGLVRIALECEKTAPAGASGRRRSVGLFEEPMWTMYCNGRKCGYATLRECTESDWHVLSTVQSVSVGAGVIPVVTDGRKNSEGTEGELLYMRAKFERVVGSRDSEAFYMMNPDGNGGPELSIFLLRI
ncbi:Protein MIZU-KUSSEI 1 [Capsicum baccatum]|uniref:Protein MIZU-KUSSEI 1 n=2 Tax=Capsicum TaxID=4071 RepID=A0A1U8GTB5_CAPAN|nr:protein MIZU-KUSSEI 1 [Capsicum annuum]KAF3632038.1 Protein MIZU-KUSSEI 1 [Capsicum annuum]KAF3674878.1 Protein MIZU-KUSSEI 1 [Capsicum annuum]PHT54512.1 Protein MIZU-KUSSEI 1 [Capsicum baccatum]PHT80662.1 Protein MIZU-KUSSEI 1 [Capsicum annuum]